MVLSCLSSLISFIPLLSLFLLEQTIAVSLFTSPPCPELPIFQLFSPSNVLSPSASLPIKLFLLLHLLTKQAFHNGRTCFYLIQTDFLKPINTSHHSPAELIFCDRFTVTETVRYLLLLQSFFSLTSLLLALTIELSRNAIRTWFHCTSYCIKTAHPHLQGLPNSLISFSG